MAENITNNYKRLIDWKRGIPYTWTIDDYEEILNSDAFWACKFDYSKNPDIVNAIFETLGRK